jgi:hypothetical protein
MSARNGDRSRHHRLRRQKLRRREIAAAVQAERTEKKPAASKAK